MALRALAFNTLSLVTCMAACSGKPSLYGEIDLRGSGGDLQMHPGVVRSSAYPRGPYGSGIGDTLTNISGPGYRLTPQSPSSTIMVPWEAKISLQEVRVQPAYTCLFVNFSASWCGACEDEQKTLAKRAATTPALGIFEVLVEGLEHDSQGKFPVDKANVDAWTQMFRQTFPVIQGDDATHALLDRWNPPGTGEGFPFNMVVEPDSMRILDAFFGDASDALLDGAIARCRGQGP